MSLWPNDLLHERVLSPRDIMNLAGDELEAGTKVLAASIREETLPDRIVLGFMVRSRTGPLEVSLFEASHRLNLPYPAVIEPPPSDIPEFLKREKRIPALAELTSGSWSTTLQHLASGRTEMNEWVCATPAEFEEKLKKLLALDHVKAKIVSLLATRPSDETSLNSPKNETTPAGSGKTQKGKKR